MILTTTGFYATGSSAISDLLSECENVSCPGDYEFRFVHDPGGISDLEYNLIENPNRHNSSQALKNFIKISKLLDHVWFVKRYRKLMGKDYMQLTTKYVNALSESQYFGAWHYDVYEKGNLFYIISRIYSHANQILHKIFGIPIDSWGLISKKTPAYLTITNEEKFLRETRKYITEVANLLNKKKREYVFLDQIVPPSNLKRYVRYFDNIRIIVVDRDPRDVFIGEKEVYRGSVAPEYDIEKFCEWYRWTREIYYSEERLDCVLNVRFEDLIYRYNETIERIFAHFGINKAQHLYPKRYFNPKKSIVNTQSWKRYPQYEKEIKVIEDKLSEYCYLFPFNLKNLEGTLF